MGDRRVEVTIHTNPAMDHQIRWARLLREGFEVHGHDAQIRMSREGGGGVHVVIGPNYALEQWAEADDVLFVDRCFFGDPQEQVTIGWLRPDGTRDFMNEDSMPDRWRMHGVAMKPWQSNPGGHSLVLADRTSDWTPYRDIIESRLEQDFDVMLRVHPTQRAPEDLRHLELIGDYLAIDGTHDESFIGADHFIAFATSTAVTAIMGGLPGFTLDKRNGAWPVTAHDLRSVIRPKRASWCYDLANAQWACEEIRSGKACTHLMAGNRRADSN